jgi:5-methylcytosine-specific restriction endonuclease McrA
MLPKHINSSNGKMMDTIGQFKANDILPYINTGGPVRKEYIVNNKSYIVKMNSARYKIFNEYPKCIACGLKGEIYLLEKHKVVDKRWKYVSAHFNLYGVENDVLVLLTKDHIKPKSKGGRNNIVNYQTVCEICNYLKKNQELDNETIGKLREVYNSFATFGL